MCILFVAMKQHPKYPLIIAANRDEFRNRSTAPMAWWQTPNILAGKDLEAGGTWLGITPRGKFSALTNYRQLPQADIQSPKSRGDLVLKALTKDNDQLSHYLTAHSNNYQGFNLLYGDSEALTCYDSINKRFTKFNQGFFSLCNGAVNDIWPKMAKGEQALEHYIKQNEQIEHQQLLALLMDSEQAPDDLLPKTGLPLDWEQKLSAIFIEGEEYGTRSSCVISLDNNGNIKVTEVTYPYDGKPNTALPFSWSI